MQSQLIPEVKTFWQERMEVGLVHVCSWSIQASAIAAIVPVSSILWQHRNTFKPLNFISVQFFEVVVEFFPELETSTLIQFTSAMEILAVMQ